MLRKNFKRNNSDDNLDEFKNDISDNIKKRSKLQTIEHKQKYTEIERAMLKKEVKISDILNLDLPMDENIWFFEYLQILEKTEEFTEEHYKIKNMIFNRYDQLKNINVDELNKLKNDSGLNCDIVTRILKSDHECYVKAILYKKYKRCYDNMNYNSSDELFKVIEWIDNILDLPTKIKNKSQLNVSDKLKKLWDSMNERIYGLKHVKEKVMEVVCAKLLDPDSKGSILTLVGPPGVGKTAIATSIADAMEMPFDQISFGSVKDSSVLTGQQSVWIASSPGLFTKILLKSKRQDTVVLLDEIDKIPDTPEGRSITSVLFHVLDRTQNNRFKDMYMPEILLDLSKMVFLCAANSLNDIDPILKNRMTIIEINGYSITEKTEIALEHMIPKIKKDLGFSESDIIFLKKDLEYLIENKTCGDNGMREVERKLYQLFSRLSLLKHAKGIQFSYKISHIKFPYKIDENTINKLL